MSIKIATIVIKKGNNMNSGRGMPHHIMKATCWELCGLYQPSLACFAHENQDSEV